MYCKKCGTKLEIENQRFCQVCGTEIRRHSYNSQLGNIRDPYKPLSTPPPRYQDDNQFHLIQTTRGPYSKRCLGLGIVSLILAVFSFNIGSTILMDNLYYYIQQDRVFMGLIIAHIIGIIFGILNRFSYRQAGLLEADSSILKAGNILGIIGIALNSILMLLAFTMI